MEKPRKRGPDGRFTGPRWDVEGIPRLPTFPARWVLDDPRRRPYLVFWGPEHGPAFALKMMPSAEGDAVLIEFKNGKTQQILILRRPLPRGTGTAIFYKLVEHLGLRCQVCAGLRFASQGWYKPAFTAARYRTWLADAGGYWVHRDAPGSDARLTLGRSRRLRNGRVHGAWTPVSYLYGVVGSPTTP